MSFIEKLLKIFVPWKSSQWVMWISQNASSTCVSCKDLHGKIYSSSEVGHSIHWPMHLFCHCILQAMDVIPPGTATQDGTNGADYSLTHRGKLPDNYITKNEAGKYGWNTKKGNLSEVANGKIIGGDVYKNNEGKLPQANGRVWYEADINYSSGYRGSDRIFYSNDGLIFVSYDHGTTFYEISE